MRVRVACFVLGVLLIPTLARADSHIADFYSGFSGGGGGSTLLGFHQSFAKAWAEPPWCKLSAVGDVSVQFGSHNGRDVTQVVYSGGPRCTFAKHDWRNLLQAQLLVGGVYTNDGVAEPNDKALVLGVTYDRALTKASTRDTPFKGWGVRVEADRVFNGGDRESVNRYSVGLIYRFPH